MNTLMRYQLAHQETQLGVGYFSPRPAQDMSLEDCLDAIRRWPNDEFMRGHARQLLAKKDEKALRSLFAATDSVTRGLILETTLLTPALADLWHELDPELKHNGPELCTCTPQIFLSSVLLPDHEQHAQASRRIGRNLFEHAPLPDLPADTFCAAVDTRPSDPARIRATLPATPARPRRPAAETHLLAMEKLYGLGIVDGPEMRHHASLSPWGLLRRWRLDRTMRNGTFAYRLDGILTSYGRGLHLDDARASLAMEMVERYSSFADIRDMIISGSRSAAKIHRARWSELGQSALDPNHLRLEVPYHDHVLHWMEATDAHGISCSVPVQCVYLFSNLGEIQLFSALGSTGLASGNTPEEAKVSGLLEVIERDCEAIGVFDLRRCFRLASRDQDVNRLLERHQEQGIDTVFQDLTSELGVPCYKCFVRTAHGELIKATGAGLSGQRAALSALTETPFPFPDGPSTAPGPTGLPVRILEDLPDYSTGSAEGDLKLLEAILSDQGYTPLYADLTKRELGLPVYRSIVPGLETATDYDRFSRISPRVWREVLKTRDEDL